MNMMSIWIMISKCHSLRSRMTAQLVLYLFGCADRREVPSDYFHHSVLGVTKVSRTIKIMINNVITFNDCNIHIINIITGLECRGGHKIQHTFLEVSAFQVYRLVGQILSSPYRSSVETAPEGSSSCGYLQIHKSHKFAISVRKLAKMMLVYYTNQ